MDKFDENYEFDTLQLYQIEQGKENGIDTIFYARPEFDFLQMEQIRLGLEDGLNVERYAVPDYDHLIMKELRLGIQAGIDLFPVLEFITDGLVLREIRLGKIDNTDVTSYAKDGYDEKQLKEIRTCLKSHVDVSPFLSPEYYGPQIREIRLGLENGVDVSRYTTGEYTWFQMREIRLGMEEHLDVDIYARPLLTWQQMEQLRLGLEQYLDVSEYSSLTLSADEMEQKRLEILARPRISPAESEIEAEQAPEEPTVSFNEIFNYKIELSDDGMEAALELDPPAPGSSYDISQLHHILSQNGVVHGIDNAALQKMITEHIYNKPVIVAKGTPSVDGKDGYYQFFFQLETPTTPKMLEDGSVDYFDMKLFEWVKKDTLLAHYTPATLGQCGYQVNGQLVIPKRGQELAPLRGGGFYLSEDKYTYFSALDGKVSLLEKNTLEVTRIYVIDGNVDVSVGNVNFDGDVHIKGDVLSGFRVAASGSICIDGHVENADISSGCDIIIKKGMHGGGEANLMVGGNLYGTFFESANIFTTGNIGANYILNCTTVCSGKVTINGRRGSIIGGKTQSIGGIDAYIIGNTSETATELEVGISKELTNRFNTLRKELSKVESELQIIKKGTLDLNKHPDTNTDLKIIEFKRKLSIALDMKTQEAADLEEQKQNLMVKMAVARNAVITVNGRIYPGSVLWISSAEYSITKDITRVRFLNKAGKVGIYQL